ncbi:TetR/AcrR family transcriptional regulator [Hyphomonas sp. WL0036]|uniref:TetR/AcrR family transcriptional regulator n=1 Tax=Hyphomonas sediminis TaxID=2866160 RepID=UPI001C7E2326|nr:TetR/AcrR family transcriptional regulator [Hyphomonas sediminis]MBY9065452.1 TetR/AcrR family transcriptional regulator [Hyphomonas sediminis]
MSDTGTSAGTKAGGEAAAGEDAPARRLTQAERRDRSERELLGAAVRVVAGQGVSAATFDAIGREAGFSRGLVTQRFGSKEGLIRALITHLHEWQGEALDEAKVSDMDGLTALCAFVHLHCESLRGAEEADTYFMLLAAAVADRLETRGAFRDSHEIERALIRNFIERGQQSGHVRGDVNADAEALLTGCSLLGMRMQALVDPEFDAGPVRDGLIASLKARLAARPLEEGQTT